MTHIDDSQLLALLDGELSSGDVDRVRDHLDECGDCRRRYRQLEERSRLFSEEAALLDDTSRLPGWDEVVKRAGESSPDGGAPVSSPGRVAPFLKAAVILLVVTGVAAAIPGSPVDEWIGEAADRLTGWISGGSETVDARAPESSVGDRSRSTPGVAVALESGRVTVALSEAAPGTRVEVSLIGGQEAEVEAEGARYRTGPGRIEAVGASGDRIRIRLPEIASSARILVNGEPAVLLVESGRLRLLLEGRTESASSVSFHVPGGSPGD